MNYPKYTDSVLYWEYSDGESDEFKIRFLINSLDQYFWTEYMDMCVCEKPDICKGLIKKYLGIVKEWTEDTNKPKDFASFGIESVFDDPFFLFLMYTLDSYGFTDHGSNISSAWITDLGKMYLDVLTAREENENEN